MIASSIRLSREGVRRWLPALALAVIAVATLTPTSDVLQSGPWCFLCGARGLADSVLNLMLFMPLGAALAYRRAPARGLALALFFSVTCELLQFVIPGRDPTAGDVFFNTVGATFGWLLVRKSHLWLTPSRKTRNWLAAGAAVATLSFVALAAVLVKPGLPDGVYYGQWTPEFKNLEHYTGRVIDARLGTIRIRSAGIKRSAETRDSLLAGVPLSVTAIAGPAPAGLAPIFNLYDDRQREIILFGADRDDAVFRYRSRAARFRLDQPLFRVPQALHGVQAGDTIRVSIQRVANGFCVRVNARATCPAGFGTSDLWKVLHGSEPLSPQVSRTIGLLWLGIIFVPAGFWIVGLLPALLTGVSMAGAIVILSSWADLLPTSPADVVVAFIGVMAGWALGRLLHRKVKTDMSVAMQRSIRR